MLSKITPFRLGSTQRCLTERYMSSGQTDPNYKGGPARSATPAEQFAKTPLSKAVENQGWRPQWLFTATNAIMYTVMPGMICH